MESLCAGIDQYFAGLSIDVVFLKVLISAFLSGLLGLERTQKRRPAGARTYMLVSLGATLVSMLGIYIQEYMGGTDPSRLGAQVISGIGFLGAGTIIFNGYHQIKGLTTAAGLWVSACIGLCVGAGFITGAVLVGIAILCILYILGKIESTYFAISRRIQIMIVFNKAIDMAEFFDKMKCYGDYKIMDFDTFHNSGDEGFLIYIMVKTQPKEERLKLISNIKKIAGVQYVEII